MKQRSRTSRLLIRVAAAATLGLAALAAAPVTTADAVATSKPWAQAGADEGRSNWLRAETALKTTTVRQLSPDYALSRLPRYGVCAGGTFQVDPVTSPEVIVYDDGRSIRAHDLATGAHRWKVAYGDMSGTTKVVGLASGQGTVIAAMHGQCDSVSAPVGSLAAYDMASGRLSWAVDLGEAVPWKLVVSGDILVVGIVDVNSAHLQGYSLRSGALAWSRRDCYAPNQIDPLVVVNDTFPTSCGMVSATTGMALRPAPVGVTIRRGDSPGVTKRRFYGTTATGVRAVWPDGTTVWSSTAATDILAVGPSRIIAQRAGGGICALDRATGALLWSRPDVTARTAILVGAGLLVLDADNWDDFFDAATGQVPANTYPEFTIDAGTRLQASTGRLIAELGQTLTVYSLQP